MQQVRNALFRMRGFVERGLAKGMTCRSQMALAVRELHQQPGRSMATIQAAIVSYFDSHTIRVYFSIGGARSSAPVMFSMLRGFNEKWGGNFAPVPKCICPACNHKVHIIFTQVASFLKQPGIDEHGELVDWSPRWACCWKFDGRHSCSENRSASAAHTLWNSLVCKARLSSVTKFQHDICAVSHSTGVHPIGSCGQRVTTSSITSIPLWLSVPSRDNHPGCAGTRYFKTSLLCLTKANIKKSKS